MAINAANENIAQKLNTPEKRNNLVEAIHNVLGESDIPVMFGVVTTENIEQAIERAGTKAGNKGYDCALGAIEMVNLIRGIETA